MRKGGEVPTHLIGEGDKVATDLGEDSLIWREGFPGLSGNLDLNNNDEIVFHGILEKHGAGIFIIHD